MRKSKFSMSYQLKKARKKADGTIPIYLRVTLNGERCEIAIKRSVKENQCDNKMQMVKGKSEASQIINNYLIELRNQVNRFYNKNFDNHRPVTISDFKEELNGGSSNVHTLIKVFEENNSLIKMEVGNSYSKSTYDQYVTTLERLKVFLIKRYQINDIELTSLDINFIGRFDNFLRLEYGIDINTIAKYLKQLKKVVHYAEKLRYIWYDPFKGYHIKTKEVDRGYLTSEELKRIEEKIFRLPRLEKVRDVFIFVCYTGLAYGDLKELEHNQIVKGIDGKNWISLERKKTKVKYSIPILEPAQKILDKYSKDPECVAYELLLPVRSNQKQNTYLDEIAELCGIDKHITMHLGRHTFATTVTLENDVPIESVQKLLGHKNIGTTQIYARITEKKVSQNMKDLEKKLQNSKNESKNDKMKKIV